MLNLNFKILGVVLVCHTRGVNHLLAICRLNLNFKILGVILVWNTGGRGVNHLLTMCRLNLSFQILAFYLRSWSVIPGGVNHLLTICMLNLNLKILGVVLVCHTRACQSSFDQMQTKSELSNSSFLPAIPVSHTWRVNHLLTICMLNLNLKILGEILVCHTGGRGSIIFWPCAD